jgi:hypothetical protein
MLDKQKVVNFVSAKLKEQGCKSYDIHNELYMNCCLYRNGKLKCAIGHLIIDEEYSKELENFNVNEILNKISKSLKPFMDDELLSHKDGIFLSLLQRCHDSATSENFYESFLSLLKEHLDMQPILETF